MDPMEQSTPTTVSPFVDHIGRPIHLGDLVAVTRSGYAEPTMGTVVAFTAKNVRVELMAKFRSGGRGAVTRKAGDTFLAFPSQMVVVQPLAKVV